MTKKDGDRLRAMQAELQEIASGYETNEFGPGQNLVADLFRVRNAIEFTLKGKLFYVTQRPRLKGQCVDIGAGQ